MRNRFECAWVTKEMNRILLSSAGRPFAALAVSRHLSRHLGAFSITWAIAGLVAVSSVACASTGAVERGYDGHLVTGRSIEPTAYASFLRGVLAEQDGARDEAAHAYREVLSADPSAVEAGTRLAALGCTRDLHSRTGMSAPSRAPDLDPRNGPASVTSERSSARLATWDTEGSKRALADESVRVVARSLLDDPSSDGCNDLFDWAESRRNVALIGYSQRRLVRWGTLTRHRAVAVAERLAGEGELGEARAVAGAIVDANGPPLTEDDAARIGSLAVDDAMARRDTERTRVRATRVRLRLEEVASRALLLGRPAMARDLALERAGAEPESFEARVVLACVDGGDVFALLTRIGASRARTEQLSAAGFVALGVALGRAMPPAVASGVLARVAHSGFSSADDLVLREATDLVARGVMTANPLPSNGLVELAARHGVSVPMTVAGAQLDLRHRYLALALSRPGTAETKALREFLGGLGARDPIVLAGAAWEELATGASTESRAARALLSRNSADPLLATMALRLAERANDAWATAKARAALDR